MTTIQSAPTIVPNFDDDATTGRKLAIICSKGTLGVEDIINAADFIEKTDGAQLLFI